VNVIAYFLILFCFPFIVYFPFNLFSHHYYKRLQRNLSSESYDQFEFDGSNENENQQFLLKDNRKNEYFSKLGIDRNFNQAVKYLSVGIAEHCDLFLDMSLVRFIFDHHHTADSLSLITQILSYFPHESRLLNFFCSQFLSFPNLSLNQRFLIYQIKQVNSLRESSSSPELALKLGEMRTLVKRGISLSRRFWNNPNIQLNFLYQIKIYTDKVKAIYNELINKYPNNVRLYEDYSYFLIECATDYSYGLKIRYQSNLIKEGKSFAVDASFRSLIQAFPAYLKRKILDVKGSLIVNESKLIKTISTSNISHSSQSSSSHSHDVVPQTSDINGEYNDEIEDQLGKIYFLEHRLRLACQKTFEGREAMKPVYLRYGLIVC
jgi:hypothetical protein